MTPIQSYALAKPLARANEPQDEMQRRRILVLPWSIILTVNK
jgi:hypothetical protein